MTLQDVLSPGLSVLLKNEMQLQGEFFYACLCSCECDPGNILFCFVLFQNFSYFLLITSEK